MAKKKAQKESKIQKEEAQEEQLEETTEAEAAEADLEGISRTELIESFSEVERQALVEALLFASGSPLGAKRLADVTRLPKQEVIDILDSLKMKFSLEENGVELVEAGGKYQLRTKAPFAPFLQQLRASRPKRLSQQALETLAIVAYRQPIVRGDVEKIRGVDATPTLKTLIDRGFIKIVGHQESIGQPALYGTTQQFLEVFGLSSLGELPTLRDLKQLEAHADDEDVDSDNVDIPDEEIDSEAQEGQSSDESESSEEAEPLAVNS